MNIQAYRYSKLLNKYHILTALLVFSLFLILLQLRGSYASEPSSLNLPSDKAVSGSCITESGYRRAVTFLDRSKADDLSDLLKKEGYDSAVCTEELEGRNTYVVLILIEEFNTDIAYNTGAEGGEAEISDDIFERKGGYIHPFLTISGYYTDNVFNVRDEKDSDFITIISPGIWLALPRTRDNLLSINSSSISPGGYYLGGFSPVAFRRHQAYLYYSADFELYDKFKDENAVNQKAEGFYQFNARGGLSIKIADQLIYSHDTRASGFSTELDKYRTNLFNLTIVYKRPGRKLSLRGEYTNFIVNYDNDRNLYRDRTDNAYAVYIYYHFKPKTAAFIEYELVYVDYEGDLNSDSTERHLFGGLEWDLTAKSKAILKAGYGVKKFEQDIEESREFIFEAIFNHRFTSKSSIKLFALRRTNETNISVTDYILSNTLGAEYSHLLTSKIRGKLNISYTDDNYREAITYEGVTDEREDKYLAATAALEYDIRKWLKTEAGYTYRDRDSNFSDFDYSGYVVFFRISASL